VLIRVYLVELVPSLRSDEIKEVDVFVNKRDMKIKKRRKKRKKENKI
jgi:hypothetical protein